MEKTINVEIIREEEVKLVFNFETKLELNLSETDQSVFKSFFTSLLKQIISDKDNKIVLKLEDENDDLFNAVSKKYIANLQNEINSIYLEIK